MSMHSRNESFEHLMCRSCCTLPVLVSWCLAVEGEMIRQEKLDVFVVR